MSKSKMFFVLMLSVLALSFSDIKHTNDPTSKTGYIYKVNLNVDEFLMERALVKDIDNSIYYSPIVKKRTIIGYEVLYIDKVEERWLEKNDLDTKINGPMYEMLSTSETNIALEAFCNKIASKTDNETVSFLQGTNGSKVSSMLGNLTSNVAGKNKLSFSLPSKKLKKVKADADEYYEIKMDFVYGGSTDYYIVMNEQKGEPSLKFKIKVSITASNKKGDVLWEKEKEIKDFTSAFDESDILVDEKGKFFKVKRAPRIFHQYNNEPIGDYLSLTKKEFEQCMLVALDMTLSK